VSVHAMAAAPRGGAVGGDEDVQDERHGGVLRRRIAPCLVGGGDHVTRIGGKVEREAERVVSAGERQCSVDVQVVGPLGSQGAHFY
jgi:hypothetical protein